MAYQSAVLALNAVVTQPLKRYLEQIEESSPLR
jgi:hypothetical protein